MNGNGCCHDASSLSTLKMLQVTSTSTMRSRFSCTCSVCNRMTDWYWTKREARIEAWYECWIEEE